jgi:hypothetical protein
LNLEKFAIQDLTPNLPQGITARVDPGRPAELEQRVLPNRYTPAASSARSLAVHQAHPGRSIAGRCCIMAE